MTGKRFFFVLFAFMCLLMLIACVKTSSWTNEKYKYVDWYKAKQEEDVKEEFRLEEWCKNHPENCR